MVRGGCACLAAVAGFVWSLSPSWAWMAGSGRSARPCGALASSASADVEAGPCSWSRLEEAMEVEDEKGVLGALESLQEVGDLRVWNSTALRYTRHTVESLKLSTGLRGDIAEQLGLNASRDIDRIAAITLGLTAAAFLGSTSVIQLLPGPDMVRFAASWIVAFLPYGFLSLGIGAPEFLQKRLVGAFRLNPDYRSRMLHHECGHLLTGWCIGLPVKTLQADAVTNAVSFYPGAVRKSLLGFEEDDALRLAVVSMGGIVAELMKSGTSEGGYADLSQLEMILQYVNPRLSERDQRDRVRYAVVAAYTILASNREVFARLVAAVEKGATLFECIEAIENRGANAK